MHPRVRIRLKTAQKVKEEFVESISKKAINDKITKDAFMGYCLEAASTLPREKEEYFIEMMLKVYGIDE